jgi:malate dehydrogenase (oxaloacetate-decarboxylating)
MAIAAAEELAACAEERGIDEDNLVPTMDDWEVFPREAVATAIKAQEQGLALLEKTPEEIYAQAEATIRQARETVQVLMQEGLIPAAPEA